MNDSFRTLTFEVDAGIAVVTLNRPDRLNAFTLEMQRDLLAAFDRIDSDDEIRAAVVTGAGRAFCAGADLSAGAETFDYEDGDEPGGVHRDSGGLVTLRIFESLKPTIAAINGPAVGIGATMTLPMDLRLGTPDARIGFVFARRGIVPDGASSWFLPRLVGLPAALEWCYSGRIVPPEETLRRGLLSAVHPAEDLLAAAKEAARGMIAESAPVSLALTRQLLWRMAGAPHPMDAHRADSRAIQDRGASGDAAEGVSAFLEKRPAVFPGRVSTDLPDIWSGQRPPGFS